MQIAPDFSACAQPPSDFLAPSVTTPDENVSSYDTLLALFSAEVQSSDVPEQIWMREVADYTWEVFRLRRLKVRLRDGAAEEGLRLLLIGLGVDDAGPLAARWEARDADAVAAVDAMLAKAELGKGAIRAQALCLRLDQMERIHRLEGDAIASRDRALREIERHRARFAAELERVARAADAAAAREAGKAVSQPEAGQ